MKTIQDDRVTTTYGFFECPECKSTFYGGGPALHEKRCNETGYENYIYHVGPKCAEYATAEKASAE